MKSNKWDKKWLIITSILTLPLSRWCKQNWAQSRIEWSNPPPDDVHPLDVNPERVFDSILMRRQMSFPFLWVGERLTSLLFPIETNKSDISSSTSTTTAIFISDRLRTEPGIKCAAQKHLKRSELTNKLEDTFWVRFLCHRQNKFN